VNQLQHALQAAVLAKTSEAKPSLVAAALLHDMGHFIDEAALPAGSESNLDDKHEYKANHWLRKHFGPKIADPVRLHVLAKRYLCTVDSGYENQLSPTSRKSYHDQGGPMTDDEQTNFESEPMWEDALQLRRWDDQAKDPTMQTPSLEEFLPLIRSCLRNPETLD
jgi:predicted HD phosphohydrolase